MNNGSKRVVVSGMGVFCPLGDTLEAVVARLQTGQGAVRTIESFKTEHLSIKHAAEIPSYCAEKYFAPEDTKLDRTAQFGILAAQAAVKDAGLSEDVIHSDRLALVTGICAGGQGEPPQTKENPFDIDLFAFPDTAIYVQADAIGKALGLHGPRCTISTACASSGTALAFAYEWIRAGRADYVLVGGTDAFSVFTYAGFYALGAMAPKPISPFSEGIGVTFGEGAGFVVLESLQRARARDAKIYGEFLGYGLTGDAHHVTSPHPAGEGLRRAMARSLQRGQLKLEDVNYINAHGTGTRDNDTAETQAIMALYEGHKIPAVSSSKSFFGHTLGAAGILEFIVSMLAMKESFIPPTINFESARPGCELDYVPNTPRQEKIRAFISNSAAFGGVNAAVAAGQLRETVIEQPIDQDEIWITGTGVVSPIGCGREAFRSSLIEGKSGIRPIDRFATNDYCTRFAALVDGFNARKLAPTLDIRRVELLTRYGLVAAQLAFQDGKLDLRNADSEKLGLVMGLTYGSMTVQDDFQQSLLKDGLEKMSAKYFPSMVVSTIGGQVSQAFKLRGPNNTVVDGITSGLTALVHAHDLLKNDANIDAMAVVAADEIGELFFDVFNRRGWLASDQSESTTTHLNAYGNGRGLVVGEGAACVVLERASVARKRGAKPLAKIAGVGASADGYAYRSFDPNPNYLVHAISAAIEEAGLEADKIDWALGHGRGVPAFDQREMNAWLNVFGDKLPPISCLSGNVGICGASSGLFSIAAALLGMEHGEAYPLASVDETLDQRLPFVRGSVRPGSYQNVLVSGSTEHGNNHAVVLQRVTGND